MDHEALRDALTALLRRLHAPHARPPADATTDALEWGCIVVEAALAGKACPDVALQIARRALGGTARGDLVGSGSPGPS